MLSASNIKLINSLQFKKYRDRNKLYIIEGEKLVEEFLRAGKKLNMLLALPSWISKTDDKLLSRARTIHQITQKELKKISTLKTPQGVIALVETETQKVPPKPSPGEICIALDNIRDPGNLGTIIRIAAWFGIRKIICSKGTVDVYNPKTIQSSMGSVLHVDVYYTGLKEFLSSSLSNKIPVYGTTLHGSSVYEICKTPSGILLFGNESKGIGKELLPLITHQITIPSCAGSSPGIDSLNVAMSVAIISSEFRRVNPGS